MLLQKMKLENFQGIKSLEIDFQGKNAYIYGMNATNKTTIYNAYTWLLFDKSSTGAKNFTPKTYTADGEAHYLMHSAEAVFSDLTLKKVFREVYTRKRGTQEDEFTGHTTDYYVNSVAVSQMQYNETLKQHCGTPEQSRLITVLDYFPETLNWTDRRRLLIEICGDVSDSDVISANKSLSDLASLLLKYRNIDDLKKAACIKKSESNRLLQEIPTRIDETEQGMPNTDILDKSKLTSELEALNVKIKQLITQRAEASSAGTSQISDEIRSIELEIKQLRSEWAEKKASLTSELYEKINACNAKQAEVSHEIRMLDSSISGAKERIEKFENTLSDHRRKYTELSMQNWDENQAVCPTCNQRLPEERVAELKGKFNRNKTETIEKLLADGNALKLAKSKEEARIAALEAEHKNYSAQLAEVNSEIERLNAQSSQISNGLTPVEQDSKFIELTEQISKLNQDLQNTKNQSIQQLSEIDEQIRSLESEITQINKQLSLFDVADRSKARIEELEARLIEVQETYKEQDKVLMLCEAFMKAKMTMLSDRINNRFKKVKFRLFQNQINGGVAEDCEVMIPSPNGDMVPYTHANHGAKVNAGLEIISVLSDAWNLSLPLFIDNAESVTNINLPTVQTIQLIVSEPDKTLRFEFV